MECPGRVNIELTNKSLIDKRFCPRYLYWSETGSKRVTNDYLPVFGTDRRYYGLSIDPHPEVESSVRMIYGMGIDLIDIDRVKKEIERSGDAFCNRIFTEQEIRTCRAKLNPNVQSQCFAARFSAKEAFFKAIGTGVRGELHWKDVEVVNDPLGKPVLHLKGKVLEMVETKGISEIQLSISHTRQLATAVVILEK